MAPKVSLPIPRRESSYEPMPAPLSLREKMLNRLAGQDDAVDKIIPYVELYQYGLSPENRPIGVFLLLGPTGTGKTLTVEALAESLHGSKRNLLQINCGEFQMEHEVAKLIGAPPGYLGHGETQPMIDQHKINAVASERSGISLILFDEIEKAASSLMKILLGVLDKATLRLGTGGTVDLRRCMIFMTSNLGAKELFNANRGIGFKGTNSFEQSVQKCQNICKVAVQKKFSPEFINRIDQQIMYSPLSDETFEKILDMELNMVHTFLVSRLGPAAPSVVTYSEDARRFLLECGVSREYGARELKRVIHKNILQNLPKILKDNKGKKLHIVVSGDTLSSSALAKSATN